MPTHGMAFDNSSTAMWRPFHQTLEDVYGAIAQVRNVTAMSRQCHGNVKAMSRQCQGKAGLHADNHMRSRRSYALNASPTVPLFFCYSHSPGLVSGHTTHRNTPHHTIPYHTVPRCSTTTCSGSPSARLPTAWPSSCAYPAIPTPSSCYRMEFTLWILASRWLLTWQCTWCSRL